MLGTPAFIMKAQNALFTAHRRPCRALSPQGQPLLCQDGADKGHHSLNLFSPRMNMALGLGPPTSKHKDGTQRLVMALPSGAPGPSEESRN